MADNSMEASFKKQLENLKTGEKKSLLLNKEEYFGLIEELKVAASSGDKTKTWRQYNILRR